MRGGRSFFLPSLFSAGFALSALAFATFAPAVCPTGCGDGSFFTAFSLLPVGVGASPVPPPTTVPPLVFAPAASFARDGEGVGEGEDENDRDLDLLPEYELCLEEWLEYEL